MTTTSKGVLAIENAEEEEVFLYDPELIKKLDFTQAKCKFEPKVSAANPGEGLQVRPLGSKDYERGNFLKQPFIDDRKYVLSAECWGDELIVF